MNRLPSQPPGYRPLAMWNRAEGELHHEFVRVYDPRGRLDRDRCFWISTPVHRGDTPRSRWIPFALVRGRCSFAQFSSPVVPMATVERWAREASAPSRAGRASTQLRNRTTPF